MTYGFDGVAAIYQGAPPGAFFCEEIDTSIIYHNFLGTEKVGKDTI